MIILGIDGALGDFSCAILDGISVRSRRATGFKRALENGLSSIADAMREASLGPATVERIACGVGPGGFTGLRIALSYAKSLAQAWHIPIVGVSSFDVVEYGLRFDGPMLAIVVGRPGVISVRFQQDGRYRRSSGLIADALDAIGPLPETLSAAGATEDVLDALAERGIVVRALSSETEMPAVTVARVAASREPAFSLHELRADYGEAPAVKAPKAP